ncbi:hypothetical protein JCM9157_1314 [Halalkalibacter akibai JCM 9157]|uniref:Uncharacterized protein n=1 Tax=Halalkalibacter akibai (strain ATCC 43226 / DSM 21942 / CIP 109018 / JCM 9157 / 1139) TaxID=1236973 RepID=W4QRJ1_HALA3|nr:hypothetical protein JCM9157_1314 [Halalkalibacter akibai JCM 9157]
MLLGISDYLRVCTRKVGIENELVISSKVTDEKMNTIQKGRDFKLSVMRTHTV